MATSPVTITPDNPPVTITPDAPQARTTVRRVARGTVTLPEGDLATRLARVAGSTVNLPEGYTLEQPQAAPATVYPTLPPGYSIEGQGADLASRVAAVAEGKSTEPTAPTLTPEQTLSRTNANMAAAMSGQPQSTPEDQANFEQGRKAGTIQGGIDIAAGATLGAANAGIEALASRVTPAAKMVATGLLDEIGNPIMRQQAVESIGKIPGILKSAYDWANANPVKAYLLYKVADEIGLGPKGLKQIFHLASGGAE